MTYKYRRIRKRMGPLKARPRVLVYVVRHELTFTQTVSQFMPPHGSSQNRVLLSHDLSVKVIRPRQVITSLNLKHSTIHHLRRVRTVTSSLSLRQTVRVVKAKYRKVSHKLTLSHSVKVKRKKHGKP